MTIGTFYEHSNYGLAILAVNWKTQFISLAVYFNTNLSCLIFTTRVNKPENLQWFVYSCVYVVRTGSSVGPQSAKQSSSKVLITGSASSQHRIQLPDGSLFFLRAVRGEDDGTYWCVAAAANNKKSKCNTSSFMWVFFAHLIMSYIRVKLKQFKESKMFLETCGLVVQVDGSRGFESCHITGIIHLDQSMLTYIGQNIKLVLMHVL